MTSIVTSILSSTLGLLWNKARDATANSLEGGDVTDTKIREIVVRELNDIKTKLDGLARKDLLSGYTYLQEGVQLLNDSLDKSKEEQKAVMNEDKHDGSVTSSTMPSGVDILNDALQHPETMGRLKIESNQSEMAEECFKDARKKATDAFCNEALSIQDRIFATKLRVVAKILECLERPDTAVTSCVFFLKELHNLPAVREIFSVYLGRGVKSILGKTERVENVKSIMMINYVLCQYVQKFTNKYYFELNWPVIQLNDRTFNPIWDWREVSMRRSWGDELKQPPKEIKVDEEISNLHISPVNSRGEIIAVHNDGVKIISKTGKTKSVLPLPVLLSQDEDGNEMKHKIQGVAVDEENNVYLVVRYYKDRYVKSNNDQELLYVFDEHCNHVKHKSELNFQSRLRSWHVPLAVNKKRDVVMRGEDVVYVCNVTGQLKYKFKLKCSPWSIGVSENNEIIIRSLLDNTVEIYTEEGNLKTTIKLTAGHTVRRVAFHFGISKIIVLSEHNEKKSYYLHCYSETSEQQMSTYLGKIADFGFPIITSHPSGPAALVTPNAILYL